MFNKLFKDKSGEEKKKQQTYILLKINLKAIKYL